MIEARDEAGGNWVSAGLEHDRDSRRGAFRIQRRHVAATSEDDRDWPPDQLDEHGWQAFEMTVRPAELNGDISSLDEASFRQAGTKCGGSSSVCIARKRTDEADHRHRRLLRTRRERPRRRCAAEKRDEFASPH